MEIHPADKHRKYLNKWSLSEAILLAETPTCFVWKVAQEDGRDPASRLASAAVLQRMI